MIDFIFKSSFADSALFLGGFVLLVEEIVV